MDVDELKNVFTYHPPKYGQVRRYMALRDQALEFGYTINIECPESREKSLALTSLQQYIMWANAAIAINEVEKGS